MPFIPFLIYVQSYSKGKDEHTSINGKDNDFQVKLLIYIKILLNAYYGDRLRSKYLKQSIRMTVC